MKIGYLPDGSSDGPLVRIFAGRPEELSRLLQTFEDLSTDIVEAVQLDGLSEDVSVQRCRLKAVVTERNEGVIRSGENSFDVRLTKDGWRNAAEMTRMLLHSSKTGSQWLDESSNISLLLTTNPNGQW